MRRGEARRNDVFDGNPQAISLLTKNLTIIVKEDIRSTMLPFLIAILNYVQFLLSFNARLLSPIQLGS